MIGSLTLGKSKPSSREPKPSKTKETRCNKKYLNKNKILREGHSMRRKPGKRSLKRKSLRSETRPSKFKAYLAGKKSPLAKM